MTQPLPFELLQAPTIEIEEALPIDVVDTWMTLVYKFLTENELPTNELAAKQVIRKFSKYALING